MAENLMLEHLEELSIHQLRAIGMQVGVNLPTTLRKQDLIIQIKAVMNGEIAPHKKTTNKGRPRKGIGAFSSMTEQKNDIFAGVEGHYVASLPEIAAYETIPTTQSTEREESMHAGFVEIFANGYGFFFSMDFDSINPIYVKLSVVRNFNLKTGDYVVAKIIYDVTKNMYVVVDILEVNKLKSKNNIQCYSFDGSAKIKSINICVPKTIEEEVKNIVPLKFGDRVLLNIPEKRSVPYFMIDFVQNLSESLKVTDIVIISLASNDEYLNILNSINKVTLVASKFGYTKNHQIKMLSLGLQYAKIMSNIKDKNVVLIIDNLSVCASLTNEENASFEEVLKKNFINAKATNSGSLTIVYSIVENTKMLEEYETNENIFMEVLPFKYLTKSKIKINLLNSSRNDITDFNNPCGELQNKVEKFLEKAEYYNQHIELEKLIERSKNMSNLMSEL